jgi:predicted AlkP superfamily pyrophosphatase or phosphodiesterase
MIRNSIFTALFVLTGYFVWGQTVSTKKPKLVVGIVIDQMRFDQLKKYENKFSEGGFKRLQREGFSFKNTTFDYIPTFTAPGHASIYTGTVPAYHGIVGNSWYDRKQKRVRGNVEDTTVTIVGSQVANPYGASPKNLMTTTISDELRQGSNFRSKVISVSLKDRGAILPGGHTANGAYWVDVDTSPGYFVSSTYYMDDLPQWVKTFNKQEKANAFLNTTWNTLFPVADYVESDPDDNVYEPALGGKPSPTFPYDFKTMREKYKERGTEYQLLLVSPAGNTLITEFATQAIANENLGMGTATDMINISYSVTDVVGHTFGPQSVEIQDIYLRLDKEIERLLNYLDQKVGLGQYILFLTSDHGVVPVAAYLKAHKLPAGVVRVKRYTLAIESYLNTKYGNKPWIEHYDEDQIYLNRSVISESKLELNGVQQELADFLVGLEGIQSALTAHHLQNFDYSKGLNNKLQNGFDPQRSGDILLTYDPGSVQNANPDLPISRVKGTTHGTGYGYDSHVPMLWFGAGIPQGVSVRPVAPTDIAPSLAMFLDLQLPSGSVGQPLEEIFPPSRK